LSNSKSRRELLCAQLVAKRRRGVFPSRRDGENIHAELRVLKKALREVVLRFVPVGGGKRGIRAGETMGMYQAVDVSIILRRSHWHVAVRTIHGALRIVERARALAGNSTGLPVVVFIEAANPAVAV